MVKVALTESLNMQEKALIFTQFNLKVMTEQLILKKSKNNPRVFIYILHLPKMPGI